MLDRIDLDLHYEYTTHIFTTYYVGVSFFPTTSRTSDVFLHSHSYWQNLNKKATLKQRETDVQLKLLCLVFTDFKLSAMGKGLNNYWVMQKFL